MDKFTAILATVLSTFGVIYLFELKDTNPSVGIPLIFILLLVYLVGAFTVWSGHRK
jgi:hypothetical protein